MSQLDLCIPDNVDSDLCDDPDKCPIAMCGCRFLQTGEPWATVKESLTAQEGGE